MSTYKVIQDIEAEDKLLGPLTLRQFIYAAIAVVSLYFCYFSISKNALFLLVFFFPVAALSGFFAFPWARDQPTEVWALAKIRFMLKPHRRIWDQSGQKELVTITAPKKVDISYTNGLSPLEVQSRLKALAETIDTRGWVTKNVNVNLFQPPFQNQVVAPSDRLLSTDSIPQDVPDLDIRPEEDILDEKNNYTAQHFDQMINAREQAYHKQLIQNAQSGDSNQQQAPAPDYWFLNQTSQSDQQPNGYTTFNTKVVVPGDTPKDPASKQSISPIDNQSLVSEPGYTDPASSNIADTVPVPRAQLDSVGPIPKVKNMNRTYMDKPDAGATNNASAPMTQPLDPAILNLANDNNRNVTSIAREANQAKKSEQSNDEVIITLH